jgi:F-type H+-transporting ATPase subunit a
MTLRSRLVGWLAGLLVAGALLAPTAVSAQEPGGPLAKQLGPADIIMPHITDSKTIEFPCFKSVQEWSCEYTFATHNVTIAGRTFDMGLTKHIFFMILSAILLCIVLIWTARSHARSTEREGRPKGFAAGLEAVILYLRNEIYIPVLGGHGGERYVPFVLTLFFFILVCNLFGLIPYGSTPTGNIAVTATLAIITFIVIEVAGIKALGPAYLGTIVYWPKGHPAMKIMTIIMTPVEIVGKFTKPFALTIRLFANMIAGHVIILALIGLIFMMVGWLVFALAPLAILMALFIMVLEILVAFIQAFIFSLLAAVFIGQIRAAHH